MNMQFLFVFEMVALATAITVTFQPEGRTVIGGGSMGGIFYAYGWGRGMVGRDMGGEGLWVEGVWVVPSVWVGSQRM